MELPFMTNPIVITNAGTLHDRIDEAISLGIPAIVAPGTYNLSDPITISGVSHWKLLFAPGAVLNATTNMESLLDIDGLAYSSIEGGWFTASNGVVVDTMMRYRWTESQERSSTMNQFSNMVFEKNYAVAVQIGSEAHDSQTDNSKFYNLTLSGESNDDEVLYQKGIYLVQSAFGNTMLHNFFGCAIGPHVIGVDIDRVRHVEFFGGGLTGCATDIRIFAVDYLGLNNFRSENAGMFLDASMSNVSFPSNVRICGCNYDAPHETMTNPIIEFTQGSLTIDNFQIDGALADTLPLMRFGYGQKNAYVSIRGLRVGTDADLTDPDDLFDYDTKVNIDAYGIVKTDASGSQEDDQCHLHYEVIAGVEQ